MSEGPSLTERKEFLSKLKTASVKDAVKGFYRAATSNPAGLAGGAIAAGLGGAAAYKLSKPGADGLSPEQKATRKLLQSQEDAEKLRTESPNLRQDLQGVTVRTSKDVADVFSRHPRSAAASGAAMLAPLGYKALPKLLKLIKR
jgi:hypothetical protein